MAVQLARPTGVLGGVALDACRGRLLDVAAYWLLSGYGLRAWRAVTALVVVLATAAILFKTAGIAVTRDTVYVQGSQPNIYVSAKANTRAPTWGDALDYTWQY